MERNTGNVRVVGRGGGIYGVGLWLGLSWALAVAGLVIFVSVVVFVCSRCLQCGRRLAKDMDLQRQQTEHDKQVRMAKMEHDREVQLKQMELEKAVKLKELELEQEKMRHDSECKRKQSEQEDSMFQHRVDMKRRKLERNKQESLQRLMLQQAQYTAEQEQKKRELAFEERKLVLTKEMDIKARQDAERAQVVLQKPRFAMLKYAEDVSRRQVDTSVLQSLQAKGFKCFMDPTYFETDLANVKTAATSALHNLPESMKEAVASLLCTCFNTQGESELFTFSEGQGHFAKVMIKSAYVDGKKGVAMLPYGMSFDCSKAVESYKTVISETPVYESVPESVLESSGLFSSSYRSETRQSFVGMAKKEEQIPIFKQEVLSVEKWGTVMEALAFLASKKALEVIS